MNWWRNLGLGGALLVAVLATAQPAFAVGGSISGTVTDSSPGHAALAGISACAVELGTGTEVERCATSDASGNYTLGELPTGPTGEWTVRFQAPAEVNLAAQFYDDAVLYEDAQVLSVGSAALTGIDAEMHEGGTISGTVTDSETEAPIAGLEICAEAHGGQISVCRLSDGSGHYTITGLPGGYEYQVEFFSINGLNYLRQTWNGHPESFSGGDRVPIEAGSVAEGIDAQMNLGAQITGHLSDVATGGPAVGIEVCALDPAPEPRAEEFEDCAKSDASGDYAIRALRAGTFIVGFDRESVPTSGSSFQRFWGGEGAEAEAQRITISPPEVRSGVDASIIVPHYGPEPVAGSGRPPGQAIILDPKKPLSCAKHFRRVRRNGRQRCVRVRRHKHPPRHHRH